MWRCVDLLLRVDSTVTTQSTGKSRALSVQGAGRTAGLSHVCEHWMVCSATSLGGTALVIGVMKYCGTRHRTWHVFKERGEQNRASGRGCPGMQMAGSDLQQNCLSRAAEVGLGGCAGVRLHAGSPPGALCQPSLPTPGWKRRCQ